MSLFTPFRIGPLELPNRAVMAPLGRARAHVERREPTDSVVTYYVQRASAGLLITEATPVSAQGQGYADVPGLYTDEQLQAWKRVTEAVHARGGRIFTQLWHVGRVSHTTLQPGGQKPVAPSAITAKTKTYLIENGVGSFAATSEPRALDAAELPGIVQDFRHAARNAVATAGFDGNDRWYLEATRIRLRRCFLRRTP
jgi:N-ethylmaleimide reductase